MAATTTEPCRCVYPTRCFCPPEVQPHVQLVANVDQDPTAAIEAYWLAMADLGVEVHPDGIAEVIVDAQCARGDYQGCSSELEQAYCDYRAQAARALGVQL